MLYDVLPPFFLFSSLGGIIVVISRVMLRLRREQAHATIRQTAATGAPVSEDELFQPAGKKIDIVKNRLALIPRAMKRTATGTSSFLQSKKERVATMRPKLRRKKTADAIPEEEAAPPAPQPEPPVAASAVTMPTSAWRARIEAMAKRSKGKLHDRTESVSRRLTEMKQRKRSAEQQQEEQPVAAEPQLQEQKPPQPRGKIRLRRTTTAEEKPGGVPKVSGEPSRTAAEPENNASHMLPRLRSSRKKAAPSALEQAAQAIATAEYRRADDILLPYIVKHTKDSKAYMLLGQSALAQRSWSEAIEIFQQVLKINSQEPGAQAALGEAALHAGRLTMALQSLQRAHEADPNNPEILKNLMTIAQRMDNPTLKSSVREKMTALHAGQNSSPH